jgi:uncharacterized protein (TIGR02284 family)
MIVDPCGFFDQWRHPPRLTAISRPPAIKNHGAIRIVAAVQAFSTRTNPTKRRRIMAEHSEAISTLNTLIATTIDSITGYEDSAQNIDNERFREIFRQRANERQAIVEQLRAEVRRLGGEPEDGGSFLGKAHQRFEDLKAAITGRDEKSIINEVERGEDYLKGKWQAALQSGDVHGETHDLLQRLYQSVKSGHDQMSQLKHGMETPSNA